MITESLIMRFIISVLAGLGTGVISAWGIGGGSLLVVYMTAFAGVAQQTAQGINLMYFLPASLTALRSHIKTSSSNEASLYAAATGVLTAAGTSLLASWTRYVLMKRYSACSLF